MARTKIQSPDLETQISKTPEQMQSDARSCIYAVPEALIKINTKDAYKPRVVSIGPHHSEEDQVHFIQKHKLEFLSLLRDRMKISCLKPLVDSISSLEKEARECYSKEIKNLESEDDQFLEMMVLDGCFLIELFRKSAVTADKQKMFERGDPLATMAWAVPYIYGDLLLVGNQIPFFVMEKLFQTSKMPGDSDDSLSLLALKFFNKVMQRPNGVIDKFLHRPAPNGQKVLPLHLLDLVRSSLLLQPDQEETRIAISSSEPSNKRNDLIYCISKLCRAGIMLRRRDADSFLDVKFKKGKGIFGNGVIEMPNITMHYHMKSFLVNCVAFEQLHNPPSKQFTVYARLLDCLVNTKKDVEHFCETEIFDNYFGKDGDIAEFINKMGKDLAFDRDQTDQFYLSHLFRDVNDCYKMGLETQISKTPEQMQSDARSCIYAVPETLTKINTKDAYKPRVVSIGPHHSKDDQVQFIKKHKLEFLSLLRDRMNISCVKPLVESIRPLEKEARECYSEEINNLESEDDQFLEMMVLDGCFLIELFRESAVTADKQKVFERGDPQATMAWAVPYIYGDLLLVGNQIPFFVMETLFQTSKMPGDSDASLSLLALKFFNKVMQRPDRVIDKFLEREKGNGQEVQPLHLLDLVRSSLLLQPDQEETRIAISNSEPSNKRNDLIRCISKLCRAEPSNKRNDLIYCISKLRRAGIKLELVKKADSFLDVKFKKGKGGNGVIEMPNITMHYHMKSFLVNCVAFEQLHNPPSKQFTVYARLLDCLVNTSKDVDHLCETEIFDNYFGKDGDIVLFINKMGKDLAFDGDHFYLSELFRDVNICYQNKWKVQLAKIKARYFDSPWSFISLLAAIVLLLLTLLSTFYTVYAYYV